MKWEQHSEFATYTLFRGGLSERPFDPVEFEAYPPDWIADIEHLRITSLILRIEPRGADADISQKVQDWFVQESVALSAMLDSVVVAGGDFRIDPAGHLRFALFVTQGVGNRRVGRVIQRICEIETYKSMSMLGFSKVKEMSSEMNRIDAEINQLISNMTSTDNSAAET